MLVVGSFYKQPDLSVTHSSFIRAKYDFSDEATRFFYEAFELMYKTFSQTIEEGKVNAFMSENDDRFTHYREYGGFKTIKNWISLAGEEVDFNNYFETLKKYSLVREYQRQGYNVEKMLNHKKFGEWKAIDIYKMMRTKVDKISTVILSNQESVVLNEGTTKEIFNYLIKPQAGIQYPWKILDEMFRGARLGKAVLNGFLSNEGKTRNLIMLFAFWALVKNQKVLIMSNEMDEEDLKSCLITTVLNNECFQEVHGVKMNKPESEIVLGRYRDINGVIIERDTDEFGEYCETEDEYKARVYQNSEEFRNVLKVGEWIEDRTEKLIFFKDVGDDYSDERLEFEIRKHKLVHNINYYAYDTFKGFRSDDWSTMKQSYTKIKELTKELNIFTWSVFQLADLSVDTDIFDMSSLNIANAKQIKHIVDYMLLGKRIKLEDYGKYQYLNIYSYGVPGVSQLNPNKKYFAMKPEKNRGGSKSNYVLFEYDLDFNIWKNVGILQRK